VIDLDKLNIIQRSTIVEPAFKQNENNPRGGMRGAKGISVRAEEIALANSSAIFRYDPDWQLLGVITHASCAYIHDILYHGDSLWVAAACADYLLEFSLSGQLLKYYYLREPSEALESLYWNPPLLTNEQGIRNGVIDFRDPASHEHIIFDNAHVNSLGFLKNGDILVSMGMVISEKFAALKQVKMWLMRHGVWSLVLVVNRKLRELLRRKSKNLDDTLVAKPVKAQSAVVRITRNGKRHLSLALKNITTPSHSLLVLPDETAIYLNTSESAIIHFEPFSGTILSSTSLSKGFLRGVCSVDEDKLAVGSKDQVIIFNLLGKSVSCCLSITDDPSEAIYDVKVLPDNYKLPPLSFSEHLKRAVGITSAVELIN
jgi:hypothetical protein